MIEIQTISHQELRLPTVLAQASEIVGPDPDVGYFNHGIEDAGDPVAQRRIA